MSTQEKKQREPGYYWIMISDNSDWVIAEWDGDRWLYDFLRFQGKTLANIHEERIKNPYEQTFKALRG